VRSCSARSARVFSRQPVHEAKSLP
jgi:hypothetical protein